MAVTKEKPAPYAPGRTVLDLVSRYREKNLPKPITGEVLGRAGVTDSLISRTLQALGALDLIDDKGMPTPTLEKLRLAPEAEFKQRMTEWLNNAYADVLAFVDPATATEVEIRDAFRPYVPTGQQDRMVILFVALYVAAGVRPEKERDGKQPSARPARTVTPRPRVTATARTSNSTKGKGAASHPEYAGLHPMLAALLGDLPAPGGTWTKTKRDKVVGMFPTVLDFAFQIGEETNEENTDGS